MRTVKPCRWVESSKKDISAMPDEVKLAFGAAIFLAQIGDEAPRVKALKGFGGRGVLDVIEDHDGDTFRAVYTVKFASAVYVLHAFQKKSKSGIATPKLEMDLIAARLKDAEALHRHFALEKK
jgi:phage-related protein